MGENFCKFHELNSICENFTLKMYIFSWYSKQSVMVHENFTLEKLEKQNFPPQNNPLYGTSIKMLYNSLLYSYF